MAKLKAVDVAEAAVGQDEGIRRRHAQDTGREEAKQMMQSGSAKETVNRAIERNSPQFRTMTRESMPNFKPMKRYEGRLKGRSKGR